MAEQEIHIPDIFVTGTYALTGFERHTHALSALDVEHSERLFARRDYLVRVSAPERRWHYAVADMFLIPYHSDLRLRPFSDHHINHQEHGADTRTMGWKAVLLAALTNECPPSL